ncbi:MAG: epoxyqueuosine reductase [Myxococcales bacterium]|jgi:epoxyqueuosine reductase|nr:epoxyqueuosine reductase [Myxococcales bacterium]
MEPPVLSSEAVRAAARASQFTLVGLARAEPLDPAPLLRWMEAGYAADMQWLARRLPERLDPGKVLAGAQTVIALAIAYKRPRDERSKVASYARGRDYHYAHRDRMKALRGRLLALDPTLETYACVDTGVAMEKPWAERAGLGWIGKNGCLINPGLGSWLTLSVMFIDRAVDVYAQPHDNRCGDCTLCLKACPTDAFPAPAVVDARRCISYQSIENRVDVPVPLRRGFRGRVFGCDVCQDVCPFNRGEIPTGDPRFAPRPIGLMSPTQLAALSPDEFARLAAGTALARAQYDGIRRNALLALGAARDAGARAVVERLTLDPNPVVSEAAVWALGQMASPSLKASTSSDL